MSAELVFQAHPVTTLLFTTRRSFTEIRSSLIIDRSSPIGSRRCVLHDVDVRWSMFVSLRRDDHRRPRNLGGTTSISVRVGDLHEDVFLHFLFGIPVETDSEDAFAHGVVPRVRPGAVRCFPVIGHQPVLQQSQDDFPLVPPYVDEAVADVDRRHGRWSIVDMRYADRRFGGTRGMDTALSREIAHILLDVRALPALTMMSAS